MGRKGVKGRRGKFERTPAQKELDLVETAQMMVEGNTPREINEYMNTHRPYILTVGSTNNDIKLIKAEWAKYRVTAFDEHVGTVLAELELVKKVAWKEWHKSTKGNKPGDATYLKVVLEATQKKMKLLGMETNVTNNLTLVQQNMFNRKEFYLDIHKLQALTDAELMSLLNDELEDQEKLARQAKKNKLLPNVID